MGKEGPEGPVNALLLVIFADEVVLVPNASHGLNTILRDFTWDAEDTIVVCTSLFLVHIQFLSEMTHR